MLKLIQLEWKKYKISKYIRNAIILTLVLGFFLFAQCFLGIADKIRKPVFRDAAVPGNDNISSQVELLANASYLIFTGSVCYLHYRSL